MSVLVGDKYDFLHPSVKSSKLWGRTSVLLSIYLTAKVKNLSQKKKKKNLLKVGFLSFYLQISFPTVARKLTTEYSWVHKKKGRVGREM